MSYFKFIKIGNIIKHFKQFIFIITSSNKKINKIKKKNLIWCKVRCIDKYFIAIRKQNIPILCCFQNQYIFI